MYAVYHGPEGLRHIAERVHGQAARLAATLRGGGRRASSTTPSSTRSPSASPGAADDVRGGRARAAASTCAGSTPTTSASRSTRPPPTTCSPAWRAAFGAGALVGDAAAAIPAPLRRTHRLPHPPGVQHAPLRDRAAPLPPPAGRPGHRPRPVDDPAGQLHDEAQRHHRDGGGHLARARAAPPVLPARAGRGLPRADHLARGVARRDHRLRPRVAPTQRRLAGRAGRPARHPRLPRGARRAGPRRVPHPELGARHQRGVGGDGRHARGRGGLRRRRQRRRRRPPRQDRGARDRPAPR